MNPSALVQQIEADGISLSLDPASGKVSFRGGKQAVTQWMPFLQEHRAAIIDWLKEFDSGKVPHVATAKTAKSPHGGENQHCQKSEHCQKPLLTVLTVPLTGTSGKSFPGTWVRDHLEELHEMGFTEWELFSGSYPLERCLAGLPVDATIGIKPGEVVATWRNRHGKEITQRARPDGRGSRP